MIAKGEGRDGMGRVGVVMKQQQEGPCGESPDCVVFTPVVNLHRATPHLPQVHTNERMENSWHLNSPVGGTNVRTLEAPLGTSLCLHFLMGMKIRVPVCGVFGGIK